MSTSGWLDPFASDPVAAARQRSQQIRYFGAGMLLLVASALVWPLLGRGLSGLQFMPHEFCYLGNSTLISVNLVSDLLIGISYVVISLTLVYLVRASKGGIPFHWMFLAFGTFIIACGGTHFMEVVTLWYPVYWISSYVKVITAVASVATAIALPLVLPTVLKNIQSWRLSEARAVELVSANRELSAANEKLQELDRLRRRFVAQTAANIGDWEWDIRTGRVRWSPEVANMHGLAPGAFGRTFQDWAQSVHPEDRERAKAIALAAVEDHIEYDNEYRTMRPDGDFNWVVVRGAVEYSSTGEPLRMIGMCMDITDRKRTEETLRKTEKLAATGRLAATIAHEINNPLESVMNLIFLARAENVPENCARLLDMADHELRRIGHITRQTLGFYRGAASPGVLDLSEILSNVVDIFRGKLNSRHIDVTIESVRPVSCYGVSGEIRQVFSNLLSNAIDASASHSRIRIRLKQVGDLAQVTIADQGVGIAQETRKQIFEPFFTTKKDVGTGLGLWVSRQIIQKHNGSIRFRTRTGTVASGTVFLVQLSRGETACSTAA